MNREIKFKAKVKGLDVWVFGFYVNTGDIHKIIDSDNNVWYIDPSTLCQLITEINEVKIFECDCYKINDTILYFYYNEMRIYLNFNLEINEFYHTETNNRFFEKYGQYFTDYIGNWHDGEEYLLNKIKELGK